MMTPSSLRARTRRGVRDNLLWVLAAVLGAATVHAVTRVVHDTSRRRIAAGLVAQAMAEQVAATARHRLEGRAGIALAPAPLDVRSGSTSDAQVQGLVRRQRAAESCRCVPILPASGFFRAAADGTIHVVMVSESALPLTERQRHALERVGRHESDSGQNTPARDAGGRSPDIGSPIRLRLDSALRPLAAVTTVERDAGGRATAVVGLLADRGELLRDLFDSATEAAPRGATSSPLAELDDRSVEVRDAGGGLVHGGTDPDRRFRASITDSAALASLTVTVALEGDQIASPLIAPIASELVWHLTAMLLGTAVVIVIAMRSARREAQLASARSDFIAAVSHELRMPLAQILLASETLAMRRERDERQRLGLASSILREARRLIALVENVLLFSRTGAVALRPNLQTVAIDELFADVREAVELAVHDAGNTLELSAPADLTVRGDRGLLRQALVNLLDNALKYGGAGQRIRLLGREAAGRVQLIVEDEGRGVPHAERQRVFEPWKRLARDQSSERTGTGLGLAVVREVAAACGGRVWLEETASGGTRAVLELPSSVPASRGAAPVTA